MDRTLCGAGSKHGGLTGIPSASASDDIQTWMSKYSLPFCGSDTVCYSAEGSGIVDRCLHVCFPERILMITLAHARKVIAAAENKAIEIKQPMNIAVVDAGGNLVSHVRMDGAWIGSIDISINKAFTSRAFDISTRDLAQHSQSGGQFFGIHVSNQGRVMVFAGGIPLRRDGRIVGAVGVSGGSGEQDHTVAEAGAQAF